MHIRALLSAPLITRLVRLMALLLVGTASCIFFPTAALAHRDGCHRWHSCPSDSGSYVCGDLGYTSECPIATPDPAPISKPKPKPKPTPTYKPKPKPVPAYVAPDHTAPEPPRLGSARVQDKQVIVLVTAEKGSRLRLSEISGSQKASRTASGKSQTLSFQASHGAHSYQVTATDAAGNTSGRSTFEVNTDLRAPSVPSISLRTSSGPYPETALTLRGEPGASYQVSWWKGRKLMSSFSRKGEVPYSGTAHESALLPNADYTVKVSLVDKAGNAAKETTKNLKVAIPTPRLELKRTSPANSRSVVLTITGPADAKGAIALSAPGEPAATHPLVLDHKGVAQFKGDVPDASWLATASVKDFQGRDAKAQPQTLVVDATAPQLEASWNRTAAVHRKIVLRIKSDEATTIRGLPSGEQTVPANSTTPFQVQVPDGRYKLTLLSFDAAGNVTEKTLRVRVSHPFTTGETVGMLIFLGFLDVVFSAFVVLVLVLALRRRITSKLSW